jgi:membrane fusion protein (multidrug efflux system)
MDASPAKDVCMKTQSLAALLVLVLALSACGKKAEEQKAPPPPEVGVIVAKSSAVPLTHELVGRLAATRTAEVRARIPGIVQKRLYAEGTDVKEGDKLFLIDPAPLQAALQSKAAALAQARANSTNAAAKAARYRELVSKGVIAKQDYDDALATERTTAAAVQQGNADVEAAKLNLGYATVTAPISGRAGRALVTEGALVGQGEVTPLTTVEQVDPIYVDFSQSVAEVEKLRGAQASGKVQLSAQENMEVEIATTDGSPYPQKGSLSFSDLAVDPSTGALSLRATVPNPDHRLLPGMFVKLRLTQGELAKAWEIPAAAVQRDPQGAFALVVGEDTKVKVKRLELGDVHGANWVVTGGLADGDQVIVSGIQKARPDAPAKAVPVDPLNKPQQPPAAGAPAPAKS